MRLKQKILSACLVIILMFQLIIPVFAQPESRTVRIGFYSLPGFQNVEDDGTLSGYMYDYLQEISKHTNWNYEYDICSFSECLEKVKTGEIDFMCGMQKTLDRNNEYLFPEYSCGSMYVGLYVDATNTKYAYGDTQSFSDLRVGIIDGMELKTDFENYCLSNALTVESTTEYKNNEELNAALKSGEINAICATSTYGTSQLRCIAGFSHKEFYIMSNKSNKDLVEQLDAALGYIKIQDPSYEQNLWNRYVPVAESTQPVFTKEELEYIHNCGTIHAVYNKNWIPMENYNQKTDSFDGIDAKIFSMISEMSGLKFNFIAEESYADALHMLKSEEVSMICSTVSDYTWAAKNNIKLSNEYLAVPIVIVSKKPMEDENTIVAMPKGLYLTETIREDMPEYSYKEYLNYEECFEAIAKGEADASIMNSYMASEYLKDSRYSNLTVTSLYGYTYHFCIGFAEDTDNILVSIIDKTLACISDDQITEIVVAETVKYSTVSALDLIYQNPLESICVILLGFGLIIILLFIILHNKSKYAKELYNLVNIDSLTGESSFYKFKSDATKLLNTKNDRVYALIYFNILRFKDINDIYGYAKGDEILKEVSIVLAKSITKDESFARMHSDRFVLLVHFWNKKQLEKRYLKIQRSIKMLSSNKLFKDALQCKSSVYVLPYSETDISVAINFAGYAYEYGTESVDGLLYYNEVLQQKIRNGRILEGDMELALQRGDFKVFYQPKVNSITNSVIGAEALIRWQHESKGLISPGEFIPLFEKNGFVIKIDLFVFESVCHFLAEQKKEGKPVFPISCNFSRLHFINGDLSEKLTAIADNFDVDRELIEIELTETMAVENLNIVKMQLEKIHAAGFKISIDDFGSGYSSLGILSQIRFDVVKLDRSLIMNVEKSDFDKLILTGLVDTIQSLKKKIICEGVETRSQIELLKSIGCTNIQGYYYSKPLCKEDFVKYR